MHFRQLFWQLFKESLVITSSCTRSFWREARLRASEVRRISPCQQSHERGQCRHIDHASLLVDKHREHVEALDCAEEKLAYFTGVLDAQVKMEEEMKSGGK